MCSYVLKYVYMQRSHLYNDTAEKCMRHYTVMHDTYQLYTYTHIQTYTTHTHTHKNIHIQNAQTHTHHVPFHTYVAL